MDAAGMEGRELDRELHESLFNEPPCDCVPDTGTGRFHPQTGRCVLCGGPAAPHYSTEEGPAFFAMMAKVRELGWFVEISQYAADEWSVTLQHSDGMYTDATVRASGPTLLLAFARAALLTTIPAKETT